MTNLRISHFPSFQGWPADGLNFYVVTNKVFRPTKPWDVLGNPGVATQWEHLGAICRRWAAKIASPAFELPELAFEHWVLFATRLAPLRLSRWHGVPPHLFLFRMSLKWLQRSLETRAVCGPGDASVPDFFLCSFLCVARNFFCNCRKTSLRCVDMYNDDRRLKLTHCLHL